MVHFLLFLEQLLSDIGKQFKEVNFIPPHSGPHFKNKTYNQTYFKNVYILSFL